MSTLKQRSNSQGGPSSAPAGELAQKRNVGQYNKSLLEVIRIERQLRRQSEKTLASLRARLAEMEVQASSNASPPAAQDEPTILAARFGGVLEDPLIMAEDRSRQVGLQTVKPLPVGYAMHEYRIESVIGRGGFGIAYLAKDINLGIHVAIKEYLPAEYATRATGQAIRPLGADDEALYQAGLDAFLAEARTLASFRHANIVRVVRFFEQNNTAYAVLEYEKGKSLREWWPANLSIGEEELLFLLLPLLDGLALVHEAGFLHRDIKPDNILVRKDGGDLVLLDFGSARSAMADPDVLSNVVTPGYAPIEQYRGQQQGPWTDIHAVSATLYWMVTGFKPPPAPERMQSGNTMLAAREAGRGRYSDSFLAAIDWALQCDPRARPQTMQAFMKALFATHPSILSARDALAEEDVLPARAHWSAALRNPALAKSWLSQTGRRLLRPPSWPLAVKMAVAMLVTSTVPMMVTAFYNWEGSVTAVSLLEAGNLERIAGATAGRISQVLEDGKALAGYLAADPAFVEASLTRQPASIALVQEKLVKIGQAVPDIHPAMLFDLRGTAIASNDPGVTGRNFGFREYFRKAAAGTPFMTGMVVGATTGAPGVYYSFPVRGASGEVIGVVALRIKGAKFDAVLNEATQGTHRTALLVDGDGVLIHSPDPASLYRSLMPLPQKKHDAIIADQRFRRERIQSLDMPVLADAVKDPAKRQVSYLSSISATEEVAGLAPVEAHDWTVIISESREVFEGPLTHLHQRLLLSLLLVGLLFVGLALLFARRIVRPVLQLTEAAAALKRGDYERARRIQVYADDELGRLARAFNILIDVLRQRERERQRTYAGGTKGRGSSRP